MQLSPEVGRTQPEQVEWVQKNVKLSFGNVILIATESDVVFAALRVAVKEGRLGFEEIQFHHCDNGTQERPRIDRDGRFDFWPPGFFDQHDKLLERLL
jgi:predicted ATPase